MRQVPPTNNISGISMIGQLTGHMVGHAIRNKHDLGFSESSTGENPKYQISLKLFEIRTTSRKKRFQIK